MDQHSQRKRIMDYAQNTFGTAPEYLWARTPDAAVFRQPNTQKWYALIMTVARDKLGLESSGTVDVLNIKCGPLLLGSLLLEEGFLPAYHMSKSSWISILLDGSVQDERIFPLLEMSYESVMPKSKRHTAKFVQDP